MKNSVNKALPFVSLMSDEMIKDIQIAYRDIAAGEQVQSPLDAIDQLTRQDDQVYASIGAAFLMKQSLLSNRSHGEWKSILEAALDSDNISEDFIRTEFGIIDDTKWADDALTGGWLGIAAIVGLAVVVGVITGGIGTATVASIVTAGKNYLGSVFEYSLGEISDAAVTSVAELTKEEIDYQVNLQIKKSAEALQRGIEVSPEKDLLDSRLLKRFSGELSNSESVIGQFRVPGRSVRDMDEMDFLGGPDPTMNPETEEFINIADTDEQSNGERDSYVLTGYFSPSLRKRIRDLQPELDDSYVFINHPHCTIMIDRDSFILYLAGRLSYGAMIGQSETIIHGSLYRPHDGGFSLSPDDIESLISSDPAQTSLGNLTPFVGRSGRTHLLYESYLTEGQDEANNARWDALVGKVLAAGASWTDNESGLTFFIHPDDRQKADRLLRKKYTIPKEEAMLNPLNYVLAPNEIDAHRKNLLNLARFRNFPTIDTLLQKDRDQILTFRSSIVGVDELQVFAPLRDLSGDYLTDETITLTIPCFGYRSSDGWYKRMGHTTAWKQFSVYSTTPFPGGELDSTSNSYRQIVNFPEGLTFSEKKNYVIDAYRARDAKPVAMFTNPEIVEALDKYTEDVIEAPIGPANAALAALNDDFVPFNPVAYLLQTFTPGAQLVGGMKISLKQALDGLHDSLTVPELSQTQLAEQASKLFTYLADNPSPPKGWNEALAADRLAMSKAGQRFQTSASMANGFVVPLAMRAIPVVKTAMGQVLTWAGLDLAAQLTLGALASLLKLNRSQQLPADYQVDPLAHPTSRQTQSRADLPGRWLYDWAEHAIPETVEITSADSIYTVGSDGKPVTVTSVSNAPGVSDGDNSPVNKVVVVDDSARTDVSVPLTNEGERSDQSYQSNQSAQNDQSGQYTNILKWIKIGKLLVATIDRYLIMTDNPWRKSGSQSSKSWLWLISTLDIT